MRAVPLTRTDKVMSSIGVPARYWNPEVPTPTSFPYEFNGESRRLTIAAQKEWIDAFLQDPLRLTHPYLVSVASSPTDDLAKMLAFAILRRAYECSLKPGLIDLSGEGYEAVDCDVLVIHGIAQEHTVDRVQKARDAIYRHPNCFRLFVSGGSMDPVTFLLKCVRCSPDAAFFFEGVFSRTLSI
jgi:hypothetical protein